MKYLIFVILFLLFICKVKTNPSIDVSPTFLDNSNDEITLSWSGITNPSKYDIIAVYSPSNISLLYPNGYIKLTQSDTWKLGKGYITIPLLNAREDYMFRIWSPIPNNKTTLPVLKIFPNITLISTAESETVKFKNPNQVGKSYLSLTNNLREMRLMWISGTNDTPTVYYGIDPTFKSDFTSSSGNSTTYTIEEMCGAPANQSEFFRSPGYIHDTVMMDLLPNRQYYYYFGSDNDGWSDVKSFITPPTPITWDNNFTEAFVVAFGDLGTNPPFNFIQNDQQYPSTQTIQSIVNTINTPYDELTFFNNYGNKIKPNKYSHMGDGDGDHFTPPYWSIHHIGDISYARGIAFIWDYFFDSMQPLLSRVPYMVAIGNHEYDYLGQPFRPKWATYSDDSGGECGVPYNKRFHMPGDQEPNGTTASRNLWYSYNSGPIHFTIMSTEHDFLKGSPQYKWIENDLASIDRTSTPYLIFSGHRPMYTTSYSTTQFKMFGEIREAFEPLFIKYDVNIALWGHVHTYERTCGIIKNYTCAEDDNDGTIHVVIGMAGNTFQTPWDGSDLDDGFGHEDLPEWSVFRSIDYGHSRIYANQDNLVFEFVSNHRNLVHDSFIIKNKYGIH